MNAAQGFVREADIASDAPMLSDRVAPDAPIPRTGRAEGASDPLTAFLAHAALEAGETQAAEGRPALQLMTVHSAKGLEFHTVFVTGLEEGLFPHENSLNEMRRARGGAAAHVRRAHARAARLYLTHAQTRMLHGQTRYHIASRFLDEIPRELVQWLSPARKRYGVDRRRRGRMGHDPRPRRRRRRAARRRGASARTCATRSSASASSSTRKAAATMRACRSTSASRA